MDYGKIISTGFSQAWKYKTLWIFGLFIGGISVPNFNFPGNFGDRDFGGFGLEKFNIEGFFADNPAIILLFIGIALLLFLIFIIGNTISVGGLIDAAKTLKENREYRFGESIKAGLRKFWPILGLEVLTGIVVFSYLAVLILIGVAAFMMATSVGFLSLIFLVPLLFAGIIVSVITASMACRIIVIEDKPVFDSIGDGFKLWTSNLGSSILYSLISIGLGIGIVICVMMVMIFVALPFVAIALVNVLLAILLGIPTLLLIMLVVSGFTNAGTHMMTTEFYYQLKEKATAGIAGASTGGYTPPSTPISTPPPSYSPPPPPETDMPPDNNSPEIPPQG